MNEMFLTADEQAGYRVQDVLALIDEGLISPRAAYENELEGLKRRTLLRKLEEMMTSVSAPGVDGTGAETAGGRKVVADAPPATCPGGRVGVRLTEDAPELVRVVNGALDLTFRKCDGPVYVDVAVWERILQKNEWLEAVSW